MGNKASDHMYVEHGTVHSHTRVYKDEALLESHGKHPECITSLIIWWTHHIVGIEVFYDGISAGRHKGNEFEGGVVYSKELILAPGEHI